MGEVYRAKDTRLEREVAVKLLPDEFAQDEERLRRFEREAKSLASLNHPNVAQIHAVDQSGSTYFLVLELVEGETLEERLSHGPLPLDDALGICRQIAEGLEAAHEAGVIHRDLKPANIRITPQGAVKVLDFGLAKSMRAGAERKSSTDSVLSTEQGRLIGTPTYMAPEQARGKPIDKRVDLWAFGCVLFECLTATRAFAGETLGDVLAAVLEREPDWARLPRATPRRVRELLERCLAKDISRRQRGAGDAALTLSDALADRGLDPSEARAPQRLPNFVPWAVAAAGLGLCAWAWTTQRSLPPATGLDAPVVRFDLALPAQSRLALSERLMNELAVSPDGSRIAFVVEQAGKTALYMRRLDEREANRVDTATDARGPTFSPDGQWLAYFDDYERLVKMPVAGGPPQQIAEVLQPFGNAAWSRDERITFVAVREGNAKLLTEVDVKTGASRVIVEAKAAFEGYENVAVTPDDSWLLLDGWVGTSVDDYRVMSVDRASGAIELLVEHASNPCAIGNDFLVFQRGASLFAMRFDFSERRALGEPRMVVPGVATDRWGGSSQFAVSAEGTLVFAPGKRRGEGRRIVWCNPDGSVEPLVDGTDAFQGHFQLSADGTRLLTSTLRQRDELWTYDLVGRGMTPVIAGELYGSILAPAGDFVFYGVNTGTLREVRRAPVAGGPHELIWTGRLVPECLSADGKILLLTNDAADSNGNKVDIVQLDLARQPPGLAHVLATPANEFEPRLSPDDRWLAFGSDSSGEGEIYVRAWPVGARDWRISSGGGSRPRWSADSRTLYYLENLRLMAVPLELTGTGATAQAKVGAAREVMTDVSFAETETYEIGNDGRVARVELADWERAEAHLEVVVGWLAELRRAVGTHAARR